MKNINTTLGTVPKSYRKISETEAKLLPIAHIYMTMHFLSMVQALQ
jgi:hypothetical protein